MEFNCTNTNYITSLNPSAWGKPLSSFSYSYRGDLHGLQTQLSAWLTCEGLSVSDHQFSEQFGPEDRRTAAPSENSTYLQDQVSTTCLFPGSCLTGCCSTNSWAQFNSLRLGSSYKTQCSTGKGFSYCLAPSPSSWVWWHDLHPREGHQTSLLVSKPGSSVLCLCKLGKNKAPDWVRSTREKPLPRESIRKIVFMVVKFSSLRALKEKRRSGKRMQAKKKM